MNNGEYDYVCVHVATYSGSLNHVMLQGMCKMLNLHGASTHEGGPSEHFTGSIEADIEPNRLREFLAEFPNAFVQVYHPNVPRPALPTAPNVMSLHPQPNPEAQAALWEELDVKVRDMELLIKISNALYNHNYTYVGQIVSVNKEDFLKRKPPNLGVKSLAQIEDYLTSQDLAFGMNTMGWVPPTHPSRTGVPE